MTSLFNKIIDKINVSEIFNVEYNKLIANKKNRNNLTEKKVAVMDQ
jgi:hypothetical protein